MRGDTHLIIGFTVGAAMVTHLQLPVDGSLALALGASMLGALLPDIDHPESKISRRIPLVAWLFRPLKHRGFTHSLLCVAALCGLLIWRRVDVLPGAAFMVGYASHLIADALTPQGIQLFFPLRWRVTLLPRILTVNTGSMVESLIAAASGLTAIYLVTRL